jgi:hypothetical protein
MNEEFKVAIDEKLKRGGGRESISFLLQDLRDDGWRLTTRLDDFESCLEGLGYRLERRYKAGTQFVTRTYVLPRSQP